MGFEAVGLVSRMCGFLTTWLGSDLRESQCCTVLHEPLNFAPGVKGVPHWYPSAQTSSDDDKLYKMMSQIIGGNARFRQYRAGDGMFKGIARVLTLGGPDYWEYRRQMKTPARHLILKDPFGTRLSLWLTQRFDARVVVLVRHPCALYASLKRMHWPTPHIGGNRIVSRLAQDLPSDPETRAQDFGVFWNYIYSDAVAQAKASDSKVRIVRHEDLSTRPLEEAEKAFAHLGVPFTDSVRDFLTKSTSGSLVVPPEKELHSMTRNAAKLVDSWKELLSDAKIAAVLSSVGATFETIYPESSHAGIGL